MDRYDQIRKMAMARSVPEGWGRSVVGGKEILTAPTAKPEANPLAKAPADPDLKSEFGGSVYEEMGDEDTLFQGLQDSANLMDMGKMMVYENDGSEVLYEKDVSDPESMWAHPETGEKLFPSMEIQNKAKDEFDRMLNEALIKKRLGK